MKHERPPVRVIIWGFGAMGSGMARLLLEKKGVELTGICDIHPDRAGKSLFELLGVKRSGRPDLIVQEKIEAVVSPGCADIALVATDSFTAKTFDKLVLLLENRINVISTAEQMAYPKASEPELAQKLDETAKQNGVSVLGTGINPGLIMDLLVVLLTGACARVDEIEVRRVNSLSPFGPAVMEEQGVGLSPEEFEKQAASGTLAGHVGFAESIHMICDGIGWKLDAPPGGQAVKQAMKPIITTIRRQSPYAVVKPGMVAGCDMKGLGYVEGERKITMEHPQQIEPEAEGTETGDYITISGDPEISLSIKPEVPGGIGTIAMCVNMIPQIINAEPGLKTMLDLPVPRAVMGDMRDMLR